MTMTMRTLEALEARLAPAPLPKLSGDQARQQVLGAMKTIAWLAGIRGSDDVYATELFVRRVDELERMIEAQRKEIAEYRRALAQIAKVLEPVATASTTRDPFAQKPASKWTATEAKAWMLEASREWNASAEATAETVEWAMTAAENALDPFHEQPIAPGPEVA